MVIRRFPFLVLVALLAFASRVSAQVPDTVGFGTRSQSLAGAVAADVEDASASYYNPAGLAKAGAMRLSLGYSTTGQSMEIAGRDSNLQRIAGLDVGLLVPLEVRNFRMAFGVALHLPDQAISTTRSVLLDRPQWVLYDTRPHKIFLSTNLAFRVTKYATIGGGLSFQSPSQLGLAIRGTSDIVVVDNARLEHEFRGNLLSIRYPEAGLQVFPHERIAIGLTYRGQLKVTSQLDATVDADLTGAGNPIPVDFVLASRGVNTFVPQQVVLAVAARPIDSLRLGFDLAWLDWSKHPSLIAGDQVKLDVVFPPGLNLALPGAITGRQPIPMYGHDRFVPRFSAEWRAMDDAKRTVHVRAGYAYERSPFPTQTGATNFVSSDRHTFSLGAGIRLNDLEPTIKGGLRFNLYAAYFLLPDRTHLKASANDPVGDYTAGGHQIAIGGNVEVEFE